MAVSAEMVVTRPTLTFDMFQVDLKGGVLVTRAFREFFGPENYDLFREAGKTQEYITEEDRGRVDREVYDKVRRVVVGASRRSGEGIWNQAIELADRTVNYVRLILFADQDRRATLITNIAWGERRPSSVLERLTMPAKFISEQLKYEQGRQLGLALLCAEVTSGDENGHSRKILDELNEVLEDQFFIDERKGDPKDYQIFSYHSPGTNRLIGVSHQYPDPQFTEGLWVKNLEYPVRTIGLRNGNGSSVKALYDPRGKETESAVIKALHRSLKTSKTQSNKGLIETAPYDTDRLGFRLVLMEGRDELRDAVTAQLEDLFQTMGNVVDIVEDDGVNSDNSHPSRVRFRRRQIFISDLPRPLEVIVQTLPDYISYQYEVGDFDPELGMHNGQAWDLYKLRVVAEIAPYMWPPKIFRRRDAIDPKRYIPILKNAKKSASYEYAARLGRKQRIYPSPYEGYVVA